MRKYISGNVIMNSSESLLKGPVTHYDFSDIDGDYDGDCDNDFEGEYRF